MAGSDPGMDQADTMAVFDQVMSAATPCTTAWEEVGLSDLRPTLDEQALSIAEHQESSLQSRRALAAQAKSFRVSVEKEVGATSDMRAASGALVRAFKGEIDALTTRSRFAESAFLALYKLLREAPDPAVTVQALERAARAAVDTLEGRSRSLEQRLQEQSRQLDAARTAARAGALTAEELQEERRVLRAEIAADQAEAEQSRLQALQDALQEELLTAQGQAEHERAAAQAQQQVLQQEVERLENRAALVEEEAGRAGQLEEEAAARLEQLRALQQKARSLALEAKHDALSERARTAVEEKRKAVADCAEAQHRAANLERSMQERVRQLEEEANTLRRQLETGADAAQARHKSNHEHWLARRGLIYAVEGMREKIKILEGIWGDGSPEEGGASTLSLSGSTRGEGEGGRHIEEGSQPQPQHGGRKASTSTSPGGEKSGDGGGTAGARGDIDGDDGGGPGAKEEEAGGDYAAATQEGTGDADAGVDAWLISYNRRLKNELERLRERTRKAEDRLRDVEQARVAEGKELSDCRQDVKRLEQDLVDAHQVVEAGKTMLRAFQSGPVAKQFGKLIGRGGATSERTSGRELDLEDSAWAAGDEEEEGGGAEEGVPGSEGFSAADRLLGAVKRQRERFRKEALRREREASIAKQNAEQLTRDNQDLRRENMHLYKKIRFVMSYGGKGGGVGLEDGGGGAGNAERETEKKYEMLYEAELDPFKEFDSQEKEARRGRMGLMEKWLLWASGTVLRNRLRRHVLLVYLLVLHGLLLVLPTGGGRSIPGSDTGVVVGSGGSSGGGILVP
ncbi:unnamed protein product [Scytosiphon promiscuus]